MSSNQFWLIAGGPSCHNMFRYRSKAAVLNDKQSAQSAVVLLQRLRARPPLEGYARSQMCRDSAVCAACRSKTDSVQTVLMSNIAHRMPVHIDGFPQLHWSPSLIQVEQQPMNAACCRHAKRRAVQSALAKAIRHPACWHPPDRLSDLAHMRCSLSSRSQTKWISKLRSCLLRAT